MVSAILSFILFAALAYGAYRGFKYLLKKNGDQSMPADLVNSAQAAVQDAASDVTGSEPKGQA